MAIYGIDYYGLSFYGTATSVEFSVSPFVSSSIDYTRVHLTWGRPGGNWTGFRLLRNWNGYPIREDDGERLYDGLHLSPGSWTDANVKPGRFVYYAIFLQTGTSWIRAGITSCLVTDDKGSYDWIYDRIPKYYKYVGPELSALASTSENQDLQDWLKVFAWGLDNQRTLYESLAYINDPMRNAQADLSALAKQLGYRPGTAIEAVRLRHLVQSITTLYQEKSQPAGLAGWIRAVSGWDADIQVARNLLLSDDQAQFAHPAYPTWDPSINYAVGETVRYTKNWYMAKTGGAYGAAQAPSGSNTDNTWWTFRNEIQTNFALNPATGGQYTWEVYSPTFTVPPGSIIMGEGIPNPIDGQLYANASLVIFNKGTGQTLDLIARSVSRLSGQTTMDRGQVIGDGIPVPSPFLTWTPTVEYLPADLVMFGGRVYQALRASKGVVPPTAYDPPTDEWACVGKDGRVQLMLSGYTHSAWTYATTAACPVWPFIEWYDQTGTLIVKLEGRSAGNLCYDRFSPNAGTTLTSHTPEVGAYSWSAPAGSWTIDGFNGGTIRPTDPAVRSIAVINGSNNDANCQVSVTLTTSPTAGMSQGLILRYTDVNNYWRATRSSLAKRQAGTLTTVGTYSSSCVDGDRLTVSLSGNIYTVYRNGVQVLTYTDSTFFNTSVPKHGIVVE